MTKQDLIALCLQFPGAYEDYPFDPVISDDAWTAMRHRDNQKTFAFLYCRNGLSVNVKLEPTRADHLRQLFEGITPAYHMNKTHWSTVRPDSDVPAELLEELIAESFRLTASKKKKKRKESD